MADSVTKTLKIQVISDDESGLAGLQKVSSTLKQMGVDVTKFVSIRDDETQKWINNLQLAGKEVATLQAAALVAADKVGNIASLKTGNIKSDVTKEQNTQQAIADAQYKASLEANLAHLQNFTSSEQAIRNASRKQTLQDAKLFYTEMFRLEDEESKRVKTKEAEEDRIYREAAKVRLQLAREVEKETARIVAQELRDKTAANTAALRNYEASLEQERKLRSAMFKADALAVWPSPPPELPSKLDGLINQFSQMFNHILKVYVIWNSLNFVMSKISSAVTSIVPIGIALDSVKASLESTVDSGIATQAVLKGITEEAKRTGLEIGNLRTNFKLFQASTSLAGASLQDTWKMFTNINTVATALHLSTDEVSHTFLALAQIFNKSKVQSEELVKQLGNLLPGAFASFAASIHEANGKIGISTQELTRRMKEGLVSAQQTMLDFTQFMANRFAGSFVVASQMLNADIGRMKSSLTQLAEAIYSISSGPIQNIVQSFTSFVDSLTGVVKEGTVFNAILYSIKDSFIALAASGIIYASTKLIEFTKTLSVATDGVSKFKAMWDSVGYNVIVTGLSAITLAFTDMIHESHQAQTNINDFFDELAKKRAFNEATPELKLKLTVEEDDAVKKINNLINDIANRRQNIKNDTIGLVALTAKEAESINKQIPDLQKIDSTITEISFLEQKLGVQREKALAIMEAQWKMGYKELQLTKERALLEEQIRLKKEKEQEQASRYDIDPRKKLNESSSLEAQASVLKLKAYEATNAVDKLNLSLQALTKTKESEAKKVEEVYVESITKYKEALAKVEERAKAGLTDERDVEVKKQATEELVRIEEEKQGKLAEVQLRFEKEQETIRKQGIAEEKRDRQDQYRSNLRDFREYVSEARGDILALDNSYKKGLIGIENYFNTRESLINRATKEETAKLNQSMQLASAANDKDAYDKYSHMFDAALEKREQDLEKQSQLKFEELKKYKTQIAEITAMSDKATGNRSQSYQEEFEIKYQEQRLALVRENNVEDLRNYDIAKANYALQGELVDLQKRKQIQDDQYNISLNELNTLRSVGTMTEWQGLIKTEELEKQHLQNLKDQIDLQQKAIDKAKEQSPGGIVNEESLRQLKKLQSELRSLEKTSEVVSNYIRAQLSSALGNAFVSFVDGSKTASQAFTDFTTNVLQNIAKIAAQEASNQIIGLIFTAIKGAMGSFGAGTPGLNYAGTTNDMTLSQMPIASAKGNIFQNGNVIPFAKGGIVQRPTLFSLNRGLGVMGEAGAEAILPLKRNKEGILGIEGGHNSISNQYNVSVTVEKGKNEDAEQTGNRIAKKIMEEIARKAAKQEIKSSMRPGNMLARAG